MTSVAIDGLLVSDPDTAGRGLGRYVDALFESLVDVDGLDVTALMAGPGALPDAVQRIDVHRLRRPARIAWYEHIAWIGFDAQRAHRDVFHSPGLDPPLRHRRPWVQTLHDVIPLVYPSELWGPEVKRWRLRGRLMRRANAVICISTHTADLAIRHLALDPARLHVIHHGVTPIFRQRPTATADADPPYVLYVGGFGPHKGFAEAFEVIARVADAGLPHRLRFVGDVGRTHGDRVDAFMREAERADRIDLLGHVTDEELLRLYHGASALLVTSRYEGFGRPTIEALAAGTPVVSFDNSSLGEILGDGGVLVADGDVDAFAAELIAILRDDAARADLRRRALRRSEHFDWARCAQEHAAVYESIRR